MPLETGSVIEDLDQSWPLGGDPTNKGDDHLRLIKSILITQFPGAAGDGFAIPIVATEDELNFLSGVTANIAESITDLEDAVASLEVNLSAPTGTKIPFFNTAVPLGWTQDASNNDAMLRVVNSAGGGTGGTVSPVTLNWSHTHSTGDWAITEAQMPSHNHIGGYGDQVGVGGAAPYGDTNIGGAWRGAGASDVNNNLMPFTSTKGSDDPHNHGATNSAGNTWSPRYLNMIIGTKD